MGAYYQATVKFGQMKKMVRIPTWSPFDCGTKLMEHSYLPNDYVNGILNWIGEDKKFNLIWLCDYHEGNITWDNTKEVKLTFKYEYNTKNKYYTYTNFFGGYVINHDLGVYIDLAEIYKILRDMGVEWKIHPLPILCNSDESSMGGGDYHQEDSRRGLWCNHKLELTCDIKKLQNLQDVTNDCIFIEEE